LIPGWVVAIATFPGVMVHEAAHMLFCKLRGVAVAEVCFFRFGNPVGYVIHEEPRDFTSSFLVSVGPLIVNSVLCMVICFPSLMPIKVYDHGDALDYVLMWLGVSIGMHAFPSNQDATVLWHQARKAASSWNVLAMLSFPLVGLILVANVLSFFWFDYLYGIGLGIGLPMLVLEKWM
jgi:hypothetical protein